MRIALLTERYTPDLGGLAVSAARLARGLSAVGCDVEVLAPTKRLAAGQTTRTELDGVVVHRLGAHRQAADTLTGWFDYLIARHGERPFDLLHAYFLTQAGFVAAYAGRYLGRPAIVSARGNDLDRAVFDPANAAQILHALRSADAITANTRDLARKARALALGREVTLIPNGVDAAHFAPAPPDLALAARLGLGDRPVLGFVGEARAKKGLAPLLLAYGEVARRRPAALLLVGGARPGDDGDLLNVFLRQNRDLPVVVAPDVPPQALPGYYNLIDVLLLPSLRDGLPNALLEGMACERAIVSTPVGGIPDALRDGENGRLVPPGDVAALAAAIEALLDDAEQRRRLGRAARATVMRDFAPEQEIASNLALYRRLL